MQISARVESYAFSSTSMNLYWEYDVGERASCATVIASYMITKHSVGPSARQHPFALVILSFFHAVGIYS